MSYSKSAIERLRIVEKSLPAWAGTTKCRWPKDFSSSIESLPHKSTLYFRNFRLKALIYYWYQFRSCLVWWFFFVVWQENDFLLLKIIFSSSQNKLSDAQSPTGYQKRTRQFLRVLHVYSIDNFVAFCLEWL